MTTAIAFPFGALQTASQRQQADKVLAPTLEDAVIHSTVHHISADAALAACYFLGLSCVALLVGFTAFVVDSNRKQPTN